MSAHTLTHWYNGERVTANQITLAVDDPGLLYGATVFTTLRVYEQSLDHPLTAWQAHLDRLMRSLIVFGWASPDWQRLRQGASLLAQTHPVLRVTVFADGRELILGRSLPPSLRARQTKGAIAWLAETDYRRSLPGHKTGNYLGCWLALQAARQAGAHEAILINDQGDWLESSTGNLWGWADGSWWTPPLAAGILPGVMRSRLLQGLQAQGQRVVTSAWTSELTARFTCLAYTNSVVEVIPIQRVLQGTTSVDYNPLYVKAQELDSAWRSG